MRRHTTTIPLIGQLLFVEQSNGSVTIDCVLTREGSGAAAVPVTLEAFFPGRDRAEAALDLLDDWAGRQADVSVTINETPKGPEVEIISGNARLVLEPES